jgi:diguanylate cyclase (GGDEF)-like protein
MIRFRRTGLGDRFILLVLVAALPALGLVVWANVEERRLDAQNAQVTALRLARVVARTHEELIDGSRRLLVTLALVPESRLGKGCSARYAALLPSYVGYTNIGVAGPDGAIVCSAVPLSAPVNVADRPWFDAAVRTRAFAVGEHEVEPGGRRAVLVSAYPLPYPSGGTQAVIFAILDLDRLDEPLVAIGLPSGWSVTVIDEGGTVVARYPDSAAWLGRRLPDVSLVSAVLAQKAEGTAEVTGPDGGRPLLAVAPLNGAAGRAYVSVTVPRAAAVAEANRSLARNLIGVGIVTVLALLAAWLGSHWLVLRRLTRLLVATQRLRAGDLTARPGVSGADEIGELASAISVMAARLEAVVAGEQEAKRALTERVSALVAERTHEVDLLNQMGELLQACLTQEEAYAVIGQMVGQFFPEESGMLLVMGGPRDGVQTVTAWGAPSPRARVTFAVDECWALRRGRVYYVEDSASGLLCQHLESPPPAAYVCIPLAAQGETLGVLHVAVGRLEPPGSVAAAPRGLPEARQRLAVTVAEQFALALANLRLRETLRMQSVRDPLTGLFNRRYLEETFERELRRAEREERPLSVIMLDVDRFKEINDTFGHDAGDAVLGALGNLLRGACRAADIACRYGGEEFILILPSASLPDAHRRAEEIRAAIREVQVIHEGRPLAPVRCSMGVSAFPEHGKAVGNLLRAADAALYRAKREGRDQVVVAD